MYLSGTFGLAKAIALYPWEQTKNENWVPFRSLSDARIDPAAAETALQQMADALRVYLDVTPSGAGQVFSIALEPGRIPFDVLRTAMEVHLLKVGISPASLASTMDAISRRQSVLNQRGGEIDRFDLTFMLPTEGWSLGRDGRIKSESEAAAEGRQARAEKEKKESDKEVRKLDQLRRHTELMARFAAAEALRRAGDEKAEAEARAAALEAEARKLAGELALVTSKAQQATQIESEARGDVERLKAECAEADASVREARRESLATAEEELEALRRVEAEERRRAEEAAGQAPPRPAPRPRPEAPAKTPEQLEIERLREDARREREARLEAERQRDEARAETRRERLAQRRAERDRDLARQEVEREREARIRDLWIIPEVTPEVASKTPRERGETLVPLVRPTTTRRVQTGPRCARCGHRQSAHRNGGRCRVKGCGCPGFVTGFGTPRSAPAPTKKRTKR